MFALILPFHSDGHRLSSSLSFLAQQDIANTVDEILLCHNGPGVPELPREGLPEQLKDKVVVLHTDRKGIGAGYRLGIQSAKAPFVVLSASDLPFGISDLSQFYATEDSVRAKALLLGSKWHRDSVMSGYGFVRTLASRLFWIYRIALFGFQSPLDSQGTVCLPAPLARTLLELVAEDDFLFTPELVGAALHCSISCVELPVVFRESDGASSVNLGGDGVQMLAGLFRHRLNLFRRDLG